MTKKETDDGRALSPQLKAKIANIDFTSPILPSRHDQLETERFIKALEASSEKFGLFKIL